MTDWIEHDGGPQPVADDVWVQWDHNKDPHNADVSPAQYINWTQYARWRTKGSYHILNQHLIDAARIEGIRLGLEAAAKEADIDWHDPQSRSQARLTVAHIRDLDPATIAKEADQ
jgi:hypothetical protein